MISMTTEMRLGVDELASLSWGELEEFRLAALRVADLYHGERHRRMRAAANQEITIHEVMEGIR